MADTVCSWCRIEPWLYKCSACDPRKEKALCFNCSRLWHSRGFARSHQLTSSYGETRSFLDWGSTPNGVANSIINTAAAARPARDASSVVSNGDRAREVAVNVVVDTKPTARTEDKTETKSLATANEEKVQEESKKDGGEEDAELVEDGYEFEVVGESVSSGEDADAMSVEQDGEVEEAKDLSAQDTSATTANSASLLVSTLGSKAPRVEELPESNADEEKKKSLASSQASTATHSTSVTNSTNPAPTEASPASSAASLAAPTDAPTVSVSVPPAPANQPTATTAVSTVQSRSKSTLQPKPVDLEKLLRWFPTTDHVLMEMLATRIEAALVVEDALICARIGKCEEPTCRSVLLHYEHCKSDEVCRDPKCTEISVIYRHLSTCSAKSSTDGEKVVCPFCIRIRQRRTLGVCAAFDHLINDQRRALQGAHNEATRNFCLQSINRWTERKQPLRAESDRLNRLARESSAPIFNFPKYRWHLSDNVFIKREPTSECTTPSESSTGGQVAEQLSETQDDGNSIIPVVENAQQSQDALEDSIPGTANFNADFINQLLRAKAEGDNREMAQREFAGVMELGYAIVDASFCAPSKAQRCLLNCKSILDHLQHHLDLQVCSKPMCGAVEHHFAHLSECKARDENESCEYCLRMEERRLIRAVDFMEAEQPEAEAKVQKIINEITASFTSHRPDEREQEMIQLEDELDQAEANKQELLEKLGARRNELRQVRRSMENRGISASNSRRLPVHFTKTQRSEGSGSNKKRRLADSNAASSS